MLSRPRVEAVLAPHQHKLYVCISNGVAKYSASYLPELAQVHTHRTRASIRHDHIVDEVRRAFDGVPGVEMLEQRGLFLLVIKSIVAIRFHKVDEDGTCASNATVQTLLFHNQQPMPQQEEIAGIPAHATHLVGGYTLNRLRTAIAEVTLSCPNGTGVSWKMDLTPVTAPLADLTQRRAEMQPDTKPRQIRGRKRGPSVAKADGDDGER